MSRTTDTLSMEGLHSADVCIADVCIAMVRLPPCRSYVEGNLSRVNSVLYDAHERILDYVSQCCERIRSHMMRHLPSVISIARSRNPL